MEPINIFDTIVGKIIKDYDPDFKCRVYGTKAEPLFVATDINRYLYGKNDDNFNRHMRPLRHERFLVKKRTKMPSSKNKKIIVDQTTNLLTRRGLIEFVSRCRVQSKAKTCLNEFLYCIMKSTTAEQFLEPFHKEMKNVVLTNESKETREESAGFVYFIEDQLKNIKIGYTNRSVEKRKAELQTANSGKLNIVRIIDCAGLDMTARELEQTLHNNFKDQLIRGEWFKSEVLDV